VIELLRRPGLAALLASEVVSMSGTAMTLVALPWFVLATTGSPARTSVVMAGAALGLAVCGIPGGWVAGRLGARRAMLVSNAIRAPLIGLVPFLYEVGALRFWMLPVIAFLVEGHTAPYQGSQFAVLADLTTEDSAVMGRATALYQAAQRASNLVGPALAGVLIVVVGPASVLWIDAGSYVLAFALTLAIPAAVEVAAGVADQHRLADGVRFIARDTFLRFYVPVIAVWEAAASALVFVLLPIIAFIRYDRDAHVAGALLGAMGAGALAGSVLAYRIVPRFPPVRLGAAATLVQILPLWVLVFDVPSAAAVAAMFAYGVCQPTSFSATFSHVSSRIPASLRPAVMAGVVTLTQAANPLAAIAAGPFVTWLGLAPTLLGVDAVLTATSLLFLHGGPRRAGEHRAAKRA
jgi:predicted MFS family arabinose efflux permease